MIKQAIIPLAGQGTRLLPLTSVFPKELLPINGKPGLEYILDECLEAGIKEIILVISDKKKPLVIIANTIKGKGVSFMENNNAWHYKSPTKKQLIKGIEEIDNA